jgi:hypothetical protein
MTYKLISAAVILCLTAGFVGCQPLINIPIPVKFLTFEQGQYSSIPESFERVIQTQSEWETVWKQHQSRDPHQPNSFDFSRVSVIAVFLGVRTNGRYWIQITSVSQETSFLTISYQEVIVGKHCTYDNAPTRPYHVILVERFDLPVRFQKRMETYDCTDSVSFETIEQGDSSGIEESLERFIQKSSEWVTFWKQHQSKRTLLLPLPTVDFTQASIMAVFTGGRSNGGYFAEISNIVREATRLIVIYREVVAGENCVINLIATQPFHIVELKRIDQPVFFHRQSEIRDCPKPIG